jgi:acyl carrier protein
MKEELFEIVCKIIQEELALDKGFKIELKNPITDLGADSLDVLGVIVAVEKHFDIEFNSEKLDSISTVEDLVLSVKEIL